jgi:uncharacterized alkaline shock family protein YloU
MSGARQGRRRRIVELCRALLGSRTTAATTRPVATASHEQDEPSEQEEAGSIETVAPTGSTSISGAVLLHIARQLIHSTPGLQEAAAAGNALLVRSGPDGAVLDLQLCVDYGVNIPAVVAEFRTRLSNTLQAAAGIPVQEVNVRVADLSLPDLSRWRDSDPQG